MSLGNPDSHETSCLCECGCFLVSIESYCPICGASNPCYGNKSIQEVEAENKDRDDDDEF